MDFELNEDQRAIAEMAGSLMSDYCTDECLRDWDLSGQPYMQAVSKPACTHWPYRRLPAAVAWA